MRIALVTPPSAEPLTTVEARLYLGLGSASDEDDALVRALCKTARELLEEMTSRALATQTRDLFLNAFPAGKVLPIPRPPLVSVTHVKYYDAAGTLQTMDPAAYVASTDGLPGTIYATSGWPLTDERPGAVQVRHVCGYDACPEPLLLAIRYLVHHWYECRDPSRAMSKQIEMTISALAAPYRVRYRLPE